MGVSREFKAEFCVLELFVYDYVMCALNENMYQYLEYVKEI